MRNNASWIQKGYLVPFSEDVHLLYAERHRFASALVEVSQDSADGLRGWGWLALFDLRNNVAKHENQPCEAQARAHDAG